MSILKTSRVIAILQEKIKNNLSNDKILSGTFVANFVPLTTLWSCIVNWPKVATAWIKEIQIVIFVIVIIILAFSLKNNK